MRFMINMITIMKLKILTIILNTSIIMVKLPKIDPNRQEVLLLDLIVNNFIEKHVKIN